MPIDQIIEFKLKVPWPPSRTCTLLLKLVTFTTKQKSPKQAMYLASPTWAKLLTKFIPKFKIFNVFSTRSVSKGKTKQLIFFNWLLNVKFQNQK